MSSCEVVYIQGCGVPHKIYSPTVKEAVAFTSAVLAQAHISHDQADNIISAMTEGVGNAIRHAKRGGKSKFTVSVTIGKHQVTVDVIDFGLGFWLDGQTMPPPLADGRRGIPIMRRLMDSVEYTRSAGGNRLRLKKIIR